MPLKTNQVVWKKKVNIVSREQEHRKARGEHKKSFSMQVNNVVWLTKDMILAARILCGSEERMRECVERVETHE